MSNSKEIFKGTIIYSIGNFGSRIIAFLLLPLYTFFLNKSDLGTYDLLLTTVNLFIPLVTIQLSDGIYRWLMDARGDEKETKSVISGGIIVICFTTILFSILYLIISYFIHFDNSLFFILILVTSSFLPLFQQILRGVGRTKLFALSGVLLSFFILLFNFLFLFIFRLGLESLFYTLIISNILIIFFILYFGKMHDYFSLSFVSKVKIKSMVRYSWPLIMNIMAWWVINASDKYIIQYFLGKDFNGLYAVAVRFPSIILLFNSVFLMSFQDFALKPHRTKEDELFMSKLFNDFLKFELCFVLFMILFSPILVKYVISAEYESVWRFMPFLYIGVAFSALSSFVGLGYLISKDTMGVNTTTLIGAAVNVAISLTFIRKIGLYAPALGTFLSFFVVYNIRLRHTKVSLPIKVDFKCQYVLLAIVMVSCLIIYRGSWKIDFVGCLIALIISWFTNRNNFNKVIRMVLSKVRRKLISVKPV